MMKWLRNKLMRWLGVEELERKLSLHAALLSNLSDELEHEKKWRVELTLRGKVSPRKTVVYSDYETSQQIALKEFEEK